jgi:hypothetical protein
MIPGCRDRVFGGLTSANDVSGRRNTVNVSWDSTAIDTKSKVAVT